MGVSYYFQLTFSISNFSFQLSFSVLGRSF